MPPPGAGVTRVPGSARSSEHGVHRALPAAVGRGRPARRAGRVPPPAAPAPAASSAAAAPGCQCGERASGAVGPKWQWRIPRLAPRATQAVNAGLRGREPRGDDPVRGQVVQRARSNTPWACRLSGPSDRTVPGRDPGQPGLRLPGGSWSPRAWSAPLDDAATAGDCGWPPGRGAPLP
jgi:hypothetical protein